MTSEATPPRIVIAKVGLDGHEVGARVVARGLVECGVEVVYLGLRRTPDHIAEAALQEDADAVGISILSGAHLVLLPSVREALDTRGLQDVALIAGGIIPDADAALLRKRGVDAIFHPGTPVSAIADYLLERVAEALGDRDGPHHRAGGADYRER